MTTWICPSCNASMTVKPALVGLSRACVSCGTDSIVTDSAAKDLPQRTSPQDPEPDRQWYIRTGVRDISGPLTIGEVNELLERQKVTLNDGLRRGESGPFRCIHTYPEVSHSKPIRGAKLRGKFPVVSSERINQPGFVVERHLPIVFSRRVYGINLVAEMIVGVTDLVGGRSGRMEEAFANIESELLSEIRGQAGRSGAHAVVCFRVQFGNLTRGNTFMIYGSAQGTPVVLKPDTSTDRESDDGIELDE